MTALATSGWYPSQVATCWLDAYNLSPFDFTIDRIKVDVVLDTGGYFSCTNTTPYSVKGASHQRIYITSQCPMTQETAQRSKESKQARIDIDAHIITSIRSFRLGRHIDQVKNFCVA
jgi:hypothetical protein